MKNSKIYLENRSEVVEKMEAIVELAKAEERELTDAESTEFETLDKESDALEVQSHRAIKWENLQASKAKKEVRDVKVPKEFADYSFQEAMRQAYNNNGLTGLVAEMDQEARRQHSNQGFRGVAVPSAVLEARAAVTTSASAPTEVMSFTDQLQANLVLASAGSNFYSGVADLKFPIVSGVSSSWVAEDSGSDVAAAGSTSSLTLAPKKLISVVDMSAEAMTQNAGLEAAIRRNIAASIAATWEKALLAAADVSGAPESIFDDATSGGATLNAAALIGLETSVLGNDVNVNGARFGYLTDSNALAVIKALAQVASVSPIFDNANKTINSIDSFFSSNVGNGGSGNNVLFGDFSRVHLAQFGGLDLLYDPYTKSRQGVGSLVATSLVDGNATDNATAFYKLEAAS